MTPNQIRGFNYAPSTARNPVEFWRDYDPTLIEKELTYANRLDLNLARIFLSYACYEHDSETFLANVRHFIDTALSKGIKTQLVVFDACFCDIEPEYDIDHFMWLSNPGTINWDDDFYPQGEAYCKALLDAFGDHEGVYVWDVMNEPTSNINIWLTEGEEKEEQLGRVWGFVDHYMSFMKETCPAAKLTCGVADASEIEKMADKVDIITFHDYSPTRAKIKEKIALARKIAESKGKEFFCTEMCCTARSNPYDAVIGVFEEENVGFVIWELMIGSAMWKDIHGVVYPDGTVRDPSIAAALLGFFRNRNPETIIPTYTDKEHHSTKVIVEAKTLLREEFSPYGDYKEYIGRVLSCAETIANQLECAEAVPMNELPSVHILEMQKNCESIPEAKKALRELLEIIMKVVSIA
ncbi:hypothetical protein L4D76_00365 [Photobacterium sagamiensis]|uniref:hypothetical protein n=1 Tax=Photobacterium sagamiensis TaxID=2910241 RepID=UPI003D0EA1A7